jgi:hypothetical protein
MDVEHNDSETGSPVEMPETIAVEEQSVIAPEQAADSLSQFTYSIRHRIIRPFPNGPFEGRLRLAVGEYIVSATTMDDVISAMTVKADSLIANGYKVQA